MPEQLVLNTAQPVTDSERERLQLMFDNAPGFMALFEGPEHNVVMANRAFMGLVGRDDFVGQAVSEAMPELTLQGFADLLDGVAESGEPLVAKAMSLRVAGAGAAMDDILVDLVLQPLPGTGDRPASIFLQGHEVTEDKQSETLRAAHTRVLELAIGDSPLEETLSALIRIVESTSRTGVLGSILLLDADGKHLRHGAAPSLPQPYVEAIDGAEIGPCRFVRDRGVSGGSGLCLRHRQRPALGGI